MRNWGQNVDASFQNDFGPMIKRHDRLDARHFFNINLCHPLGHLSVVESVAIVLSLSAARALREYDNYVRRDD